jgi:hypothetical protein
MSDLALPIDTYKAVYRVYASGGDNPDSIAVDRLNSLSHNLQTATQAIAEQVGQAEDLSLGRTVVRRACRLAVSGVFPGSLIVSFDFAEQAVPDDLATVRDQAVGRFLDGIGELTQHFYLPLLWDPRALKALRTVLRLGSGFEQFSIESPRLRPGEIVELESELEPKLDLMVSRYGREFESARYSLGSPPPRRRRRKPQLPLFDSGHPEYGDEIGKEFGSEEPTN